jgi:hypothetical protein
MIFTSLTKTDVKLENGFWICPILTNNKWNTFLKLTGYVEELNNKFKIVYMNGGNPHLYKETMERYKRKSCYL